ncbi:hypothetical protein PsYK624_054360 [Phanerochaete sordida]|uniref:Uncharacterized protein n=1 Tax=Phanerochaete sordida TaxID=48140 RepID=A0A9P3LCY1_9APHY|nr:hypothetical protein PsYK624_054360 [Phanerochaete sordida]
MSLLLPCSLSSPSPSLPTPDPLRHAAFADVEVILFDVFGTAVDRQNTAAHELQRKHLEYILESAMYWIAFAQERRRSPIDRK